MQKMSVGSIQLMNGEISLALLIFLSADNIHSSYVNVMILYKCTYSVSYTQRMGFVIVTKRLVTRFSLMLIIMTTFIKTSSCSDQMI